MSELDHQLMQLHIDAALSSAYLRGAGVTSPTPQMAEAARNKLSALSDFLLQNILSLTCEPRTNLH